MLAMYATKRRRRNSKCVRVSNKEGQTKSNPSKRHRERLNSELDTLAALLPYDQSVLSKLDKLSILRLAVSYLRTKSYFSASMNKERELRVQQQQQLLDSNSITGGGHSNSNSNHSSNSTNNNTNSHGGSKVNNSRNNSSDNTLSLHHQHHGHHHHNHSHNNHHHHHHHHHSSHYPEILMEGDLIIQALAGFLLILTCDGEVFYASHTVETYLGFHQSDICHQSVYELVHSEDREELQRQLMWNSHLPSDRSNLSIHEGLQPENWSYLERNFTVRFRCLLDNTSGFLRLDIRGRVKVLDGQNHKSEEPPLALFAVCTPFGPPSLLEMPQKDSMFKSKHKLDLTILSMDSRGRSLLGYSESEMSNRSGYDLVHHDDLSYVASAHQELLKTGASGLIAYRLLAKENNKWQWLQTSARLVYKNSKPDFILCTHRPMMEEEGRDLLGKRTMDFKVTYLDGGLGAMTDRSGLLSDSDFVMRCQRSRRYKTQVRDPVIPSSTTPTGHHAGSFVPVHGGGGTSNTRNVSSVKRIKQSSGSNHHNDCDSDGRYTNLAFSDSTGSSVIGTTAMTSMDGRISGAVTYPHHSPHAGTVGGVVGSTSVPSVGSTASVYSPYGGSDHHHSAGKMFSNGSDFTSYHALDRSSHYATPAHHHHSPHSGSTVPSVQAVPTVGTLYPYNGVAADTTASLTSYAAANLFTAAMDHTNPRSFLTGDFLHSYRHAAALGTYYPEYHGSVSSAYSAAANGFLSEKDATFRTGNDHRSYFPVSLQ